MGVTTIALDSLNKIFSGLENLNNKTLLELGIQNFSGGEYNQQLVRNFFKNRFKQYLSIDLHNHPEVTLCDLSIYQPKKFYADIITNFGTSEHVEYEEGQYNCWNNIHNWLMVDGIMIHEIPEYGSWKNHCRYYTDYDFFKKMEDYGYQILEFDQHVDSNGNLNWCVLKKTEDKEFMTYEEFYQFMKTDFSTQMSDIHKTNNPKNLY
jgi:hypothetical protein